PPGGETGADRRRFCHRWPPLAAGSYTSCAGRITSLGSRLCCRPFLSVLVTLRNTALLSPLPHAHSADSYQLDRGSAVACQVRRCPDATIGNDGAEGKHLISGAVKARRPL